MQKDKEKPKDLNAWKERESTLKNVGGETGQTPAAGHYRFQHKLKKKKKNCENRDNYRHQDCWRTLQFLNYKVMLETCKCFDPKLNAPFHLGQGPTEICKWLKGTITNNDTSQWL